MAFQPVPNGMKIELNALQNGIPVVNVHYAVMTAPPIPADLEDVAEATATWYTAIGRDMHQVTYVLQNITVTDVSVENGQQFIKADITDPAGEQTGAAAAANAAGTISWRTGNTGRSFRGRTFVGGLANVNLASAQILDSAWLAVAATAAAALIDTLESIGATLVVVSRFANKVQRVTALATEIISFIIDTKVDSQRRRTAN